MVFEDAEESIETDVDAGWLEHRRVEGFDLDPTGVDLLLDIAIA